MNVVCMLGAVDPSYKYCGYVFCINHFCGPSLLHKQTLNPIDTNSLLYKKFWPVWDSFSELSDHEKARHEF